MAESRFDVIVFGATSFVGQILCRYLLDQFGCGKALRWAAAGRSESKLKALREGLGREAAGLPLLQADADDAASLQRLCARGRVIVSTVGPYALYGEPMVKACVEAGIDYCDLTGETQWIRRMLDRYEAQAKASGARIVHCCGFDSIPSDLGVHFLQQQAMQRFGQPCTRIKMRVRAMRGGFSGGTVASLMNVIKEVRADPSLRKQLANPYSLCPPGKQQTLRQPNLKFAAYDADFDAWMAPFVMSAINTRIVQRSHALSGSTAALVYDEAVLTGRGIKGRIAATSMASGMAAFLLAATVGPTRRLLERFVVPAPGEGPTPEQQAKGFFDLRFLGRTEAGHSLRVKVTGDRDPGYGSTAKMLGQAAACLAQDTPASRHPGGFWTPATLFGDRLIERLRAHSGLEFAPIAD